MSLVGVAIELEMQAPGIAFRIRSALVDEILAWLREDGVKLLFDVPDHEVAIEL